MKNNQRRIRVGIDVGGTFTHAVAIDTSTFALVGWSKVITTHTHPKGVAQGIIDSLYRLMEESSIEPEEIVLIAHSTTQATNALLEGDVAPVGIIGMGGGVEKFRARAETRLGNIELAPGKFLKTFHRFIDTSDKLDETLARQYIEELKQEGAQVIVASEAFGVDNPHNEDRVVQIASQLGLLATPGYEISQLYGLRARTRTAVINASMLPKMMETANMTEDSVRAVNIKAPLMIMRSDGGIMDIEQMRRRPILTMLSGPAAGVAAALMYARLTDGIFIEVGGTSTDISAIRYGKSLVKTATVGGHRVYLRTLDVRTVGIAGGSIPRIRSKEIHDVGPRSAHIAQLAYASFTDITGETPEIELIQPRPHDPDDYLLLKGDSQRLTVTPTCAANFLGIIPKGDPAEGNHDTISRCFGSLAHYLEVSPEKAADQLLLKSYPKISRVVERLIKDYELDRALLTLSGGGGGAPALVPYTAEKMRLPFEIAPNAPVISAIGAALAMVRDTIERSVVDANEQDILKIRQEAQEAVVKMGANPDTVEVEVEIDPQRNILRAVATGSTEFRSRDLAKERLSPDELELTVRRSIRAEITKLHNIGQIGSLIIYLAETIDKKVLGLWRQRKRAVRVIDPAGVIRLQLNNGEVLVKNKASFMSVLRDFISRYVDYGDAGREVPCTFIIFRGRILDLSGLISIDHILSLAGIELAKVADDEQVGAIVKLR